ncbi:MAG: hypothetical protein ACK4MF_04925 [Hyphomicrobiaceae bacterium]
MSSRWVVVAVLVAMLVVVREGGAALASDGEWISNVFGKNDPDGNGRRKPLGTTAGSATGGMLAGDEAAAAASTKPKSLIGNHVAPAAGGRWQWKITKSKWTSADEDAYGAFIRRIADSTCKTTHECLTSPESNPDYHGRNPPGMQFYADCADLPFVLRAYFAWMNGLPFSFSAALAPHAKIGPGRSVLQAFRVVGRYHLVPPGPDPRVVMNEVIRVSTSHFRVPVDHNGHMLADHYPVDVTRAGIRAGTVIFDALGHVGIVSNVDDDGVIHYIDAHPDNSLTRSVFGSDIERSGPDTGGGFLRWRPQTLIGARKDKQGRLYGGLLVLARDEQLPDWSDAQYYGTASPRPRDWREARFELDGEKLDYYSYVRLRLAAHGYRFDPILEVRNRVRTLCRELHQRVAAVDAAVLAGMPRRPQPPRLPSNIYITQGDWETYATPSRDAQLKVLFVNLREDIERFITMSAGQSRFIRYEGASLRADLKQAYEQEAAACNITYTRTDGSQRTLTFAEIKERLFLMSFDPHHCVELRWGASSTEELSTCPDGKLKRVWYEAQQRLRNQTVRTIGDRMDFTLDDLHRQARESSDVVGEDEPPVIEIASLLGFD